MKPADCSLLSDIRPRYPTLHVFPDKRTSSMQAGGESPMARHVFRAKLENCNGELIRYIGLQEATDMEDAGEARRLTRMSSAQAVFRLRQARKADDEIQGQTSISKSEMLANAGLRGARRRSKRRGYVGNFVDHAMTKVRIWNQVGNGRMRARRRATIL